METLLALISAYLMAYDLNVKMRSIRKLTQTKEKQ